MNDSCDVLAGAATSHLCSVRRDIREQLDRWGTGELADDAALIVSELLGNAFRHGRPPVSLSLVLDNHQDRPCVRIGVTDSGPAIDVALVRARWRHPSGDLTTDGRGLRLVDALSLAWGDQPRLAGHTVWAELDCSRRPGRLGA
jgi:anti-sigma regulatory factor (Ser/Thr protein kinase)